MTDDWPWDQAPNCAVFTEKRILFEGAHILHVIHDLDDHGWQFLGWDNAEVEDGALVSLAEISKLDPSVLKVAHIPPGWHAWRRSTDEPWTRPLSPHPGWREPGDLQIYRAVLAVGYSASCS